jgi:hypothetical protein
MKPCPDERYEGESDMRQVGDRSEMKSDITNPEYQKTIALATGYLDVVERCSRS